MLTQRCRWLLIAGLMMTASHNSAFAFVFGEPLPPLPPAVGNPNDPPVPNLFNPPNEANEDPPGGGPNDPPEFTVTNTPEPASAVLGLVGMGMLGVAAVRRRIRRQAA